jgi:4-amino-4-deoxy-L-arabinose transferase-like glycosyltransferase
MQLRVNPWLLGVLALAAVMRFWGLGSQSVWWDEAYSLEWASHGPLEIVRILQSDVHPPLYYLLLGFWLDVFGESLVSGRALSAAIGVAGVGAAYLLGRDMYRPAVGLAFAFLVTVAQFHLYYSQELRSYGLLFALAVVSMHAYWRMWHHEGDRKWALAYYAIATTALLYTHFTGVFVVAAQLLHRGMAFLMNPDRKATRFWLLGQAIVFVAFLPWLLILLKQASRVTSGFWIPSPTLGMGGGPDFSVTGTFHQFTGSPMIGWLFWLLVFNALAQSRFGGLNRERNPDDDIRAYPAEKMLLLVAWLACSILLPYLQSLVSQPIYLSRAMSPALAPFLLLVAVGIMRMRSPVIAGAAITLAVGLALPNLGTFYAQDYKEPWDEAAAVIDRDAAPGATVLLIAYNPWPLKAHLERDDLRLVVVGVGDAPERAAREAGGNETWLVGSPNHGNPAAAAQAVAQARQQAATAQTLRPDGWSSFPAAANPITVYRWT